MMLSLRSLSLPTSRDIPGASTRLILCLYSIQIIPRMKSLHLPLQLVQLLAVISLVCNLVCKQMIGSGERIRIHILVNGQIMPVCKSLSIIQLLVHSLSDNLGTMIVLLMLGKYFHYHQHVPRADVALSSPRNRILVFW